MYSPAVTEAIAMDISLLLHNSVVHIPTSYLVERDGFFFENSPLESAPVEQTERLRHAILMAIGRGNPPISLSKYRSLSGSKNSVLLHATGARSWYDLDRQMKGVWSLAEKDGAYQIRVDKPMQPRGWHEDKMKRVEFPPGTPVEDIITRLIAMIQERARE
jgi:hypothetical protein